jgi:hypothetical protein
MIKVFYFKNRNELKNFLESLKRKFLKGEGEFIYRMSGNKLLLFYNGEIEGGNIAYVINKIEEIPELLKDYEFKSFAVRSKRNNSMEDNRIVGKMIKEKMGKIVDLENPDIKVILDDIDGLTIFFIK